MVEFSKHCITMAALVTPYMERSVGRFCNWFNTDPTKEISTFRSFANVQFDNEEIIPLSDTYLMDTDRSEFDYSNFPLELSKSDIDFVFFGAEQNGRGKSFWDFVFSENKLNEIEENSKQLVENKDSLALVISNKSLPDEHFMHIFADEFESFIKLQQLSNRKPAQSWGLFILDLYEKCGIDPPKKSQ